MNKQTLEAFLQANDDVATVKEELAKLVEQRDDLERQLLSEFEEDGISSVKVNGRTVYLHRQMWARPIDGAAGRPAVVRACRDLGLVEFVKEDINVNQISGYVREQEKLGNELPKELADTLTITEDFGVRVRRG